MDIQEWNERYRCQQRAAEDLAAEPTPLVVGTVEKVPPGRALDLACGTGRNALWLAEHGWEITAVDGAAEAIQILRERASKRSVKIDAVVADLEKHEFHIAPSHWDLITICYYLQRDLFEVAKNGLVPGGVLISIVHLSEPGEAAGPFRLRPGELEKYFQAWKILHKYEGKPNDSAHQRAVAEIIARRP